MDPAVAALEPPWPRGLPIQCLMGPFNVSVATAFYQTPFIANRVAEVIMSDPAVALVGVTNDKEIRRGVGQFIDNFGIALAVYVMQCPQGHERDSRMYAAWSHAINALSHGPPASPSHFNQTMVSRRLSEDEAELFWRNVFEKAIPQVKIPDSATKTNEEYPVIPMDIDPQNPFEWNPAALVPPRVESRGLPATVLDCMIVAPQWLQWNTRQEFYVPKPETQATVSEQIWSPRRLQNFRDLPKPVQEGMIATALLTKASKTEGSLGILALPFPSEFDVRFPSLFLDHDFLLSSDALYFSTDIALSHMIKMVPSTLLLDMAVSALDALSRTPSDSTKLASTERNAYGLLMLLSKSDRPHLASDLIVRTILDRPDASSWHRRLLNLTLVRNLSAEQAQSIFSLLAFSILEGLERQVPSSSTQQKAEGLDISSKRYIKVTTVKFLAKILDDADFVPPGFCDEILSKLFQTASHVDVRVAVLESMVSRLGRCADESSNALAERMISALELAIPVLGSLNERKETQDLDWTEAENTGKLPEVYEDGGMEKLPPMLNVVLHAIKSHRIPSDELRTSFIRRIVLPVVEKSKEESARWVKLFTVKHLPTGQSCRRPYFPVRPGILAYLIEVCSSEVPKYIVDLYQEFLLTNISPPATLIELSNIINGDIELRNSNEGQYWLSLYGKGAEISTSVIVSMLTKPWKSSTVRDGFEISHVQDIVFEQAEALLQLSDESLKHWNDFMTALGPPVAPYRSGQDRKAWLAHGKPVILRIIKRIDALRTPAWQGDRHRQPTVLPLTFGLRLWLLDYPQLYQYPGASDRCVTFARQLVLAVHEVLDLGLAHHDKMEEIKSAAWRCLPEDGRRVACYLGKIEPGDSIEMQEIILRVELADALLREVKLPQNKDDEILQSIKAMMEAWRNSVLEDVRMRAFRLSKYLKM